MLVYTANRTGYAGQLDLVHQYFKDVWSRNCMFSQLSKEIIKDVSRGLVRGESYY